MNVFYQEGYDSGDTTLSPHSVRPCPYKKYTFAYTEWWRGLREATNKWAAGLSQSVGWINYKR